MAKALFRGSLGALGASLVWLGAIAASHWQDLRLARELRNAADRIRIVQLEARRAEKDFLLRSLTDSSFYRDGKSLFLVRHAASVAEMQDQIRFLSEASPRQEKPELERIQGLVDTYACCFQELVEACRRRGYPGWGREGALNEALDRLQWESERSPLRAAHGALSDLREGHWRYLRSSGSLGTQRIVEVLEELRAGASEAAAAEQEAFCSALDLYQNRLAEYEDIGEIVGRSEEAGLFGEMRTAIHAVDPAVEEVLNRANAALEERNHRRTTILIAGCGAMTVSLALAIVFARSARSRAGRLLLVNRRLEAEIDERTRAVQVLVEKQERLLQGERLAAIGQMVTGLAHESRNALQRGQACLEMLARRVAGVPRALELVDRIQCAQDDLQRLYEEVREYAAPLQLRREMHRLDVILERSWERLALRRERREARLVQRGRELNLRSEVDAFLLERVFRNVLENSLEACEDPVEISADWSEAELRSRAALRVSIRDNGPGITAENMQKIFEPFYTTKRKGTGLGLSIARRLVELHEGAIEARSGPGVEIVLILPREGQS